MSLNHAVIWIDHQEAHVMFLSESASEAEIIRSKSSHQHLHHKGGAVGSGKPGRIVALCGWERW